MRLPIILVIALFCCFSFQLNWTDPESTKLYELRAANPILQTLWEAMPNDTCNWFGISCTLDGLHVSSIKLSNTSIISVPNSIWTLEYLNVLDLSYNSLQATIPSTISIGSKRGEISYLNLTGNRFSGSLSPLMQLTNVVILELSSNRFNGSIPPTFGSTFVKLWSLNLASNQLTGSIPSSLSDVVLIDSINLRRNQLTGTIPSLFSTLGQLHTLDLSDNQLTGDIPELSTNLRALYLGGNNLRSAVPNFFITYVDIVNVTGVQWKCPIPSCYPGVDCVVQSNWTCSCPCSARGRCEFNKDNCICDKNWFGSLCNLECNCGVGGVCNDGATGSGACHCLPGWRGSDCAKECPGGSSTPCSNKGYCANDATCQCQGNWAVPDCSTCINGYSGVDCVLLCPTNSDGEVCSDHGTCNIKAECECESGYEGAACERSTAPVGLIISIILFVIALIIFIGAGAGSIFLFKKYNMSNIKYQVLVDDYEHQLKQSLGPRKRTTGSRVSSPVRERQRNSMKATQSPDSENRKSEIA